MVAPRSALDLIEASLGGGTAQEIGGLFMATLQPFGVRAIYARAYVSSAPATEHVYSRLSPPGWESFYAEKRFQDVNYLTREVRHRDRPFAWSRITLRTPRERELARALIDNGFPDGLAIPVQGPDDYVGVTSLAFDRLWSLSSDERSAISLAGLVLHERMRTVTPPRPVSPASLSPREIDCLAFIAEGRTDGEIANRLGISETTVIAHVQSLRRKLGARNRAHAVALGIVGGLVHAGLDRQHG